MAPEIADPLADFTRGVFTHESETHEVYRSGTGPAVIVMAEIPEDRRHELEQACENCPTQALSIED